MPKISYLLFNGTNLRFALFNHIIVDLSMVTVIDDKNYLRPNCKPLCQAQFKG
jgi:hypothetical protein